MAFSVFSLTGGRLTAPRIFTSLALFDIIRFPLLVFPELVSQVASLSVSLKRVQAFLEADEARHMPHHLAAPSCCAISAHPLSIITPSIALLRLACGLDKPC